jgi:TPR repeat protein
MAAVSWYRKAAEQGIADAQVNLGNMYASGQGVPQDYAAAVSWYRKAAEQGYAGAQYNLGQMYRKGQGVPQDYVTAHMWFNLAAAAGDDRAAEVRDVIAKQMTPAQIAEAQKLAREADDAIGRRPNRGTLASRLCRRGGTSARTAISIVSRKAWRPCTRQTIRWRPRRSFDRRA